MPRDILIQVGDGERRVAVIDNKKLDDFYIELDRYQSCLGNIYKGKVESILPSINGAFVNIGQERNGFLYLTDADHPYVDIFKESFVNRYGQDGTASGEDVIEPSSQPKLSPLSFLDRILNRQQKKIKSQDALKNEQGHSKGRDQKKNRSLPLKVGQEILVQVEKDAFGAKGARLTTHLSIPGRFVVYMPYDRHLGVSQKISSPEERHRLRDIIRQADFVKEGGFIIRTVSAGQDQKELLNDARFVYEKWQKVIKLAQTRTAPSMIYKEGDIIWKVVRDHFRKDINGIYVDSKYEYDKICKYIVALVDKTALKKIYHHTDEEDIFLTHQVHEELNKIYDTRIHLKSGGHIVIEPTEGVIVVDVNSGRYKTSASPEDAAFFVNMEAVPEIARQLRIRDLGGIIVIDFIDMTREEHKRKVLDALRLELSKDMAKTEVNKISNLGLIEMTRERTGKTLESIKFFQCPYCQGRGKVRID